MPTPRTILASIDAAKPKSSRSTAPAAGLVEGTVDDHQALVDQEEAKPEGRRFETVDLAALAEQGIPEPTLIADGRLYLGALHALAGSPEAGKTALLHWWAVGCLKAGRPVVILDEEMGRELTVASLLALGATITDLKLLGYCEFPRRRFDSDDQVGLWRLLERWQPALVGYDSAGTLLSAAGRDEDSARDVTPFYSMLLAASREFGVASVLTDHVTKAQEGGGRYARGSTSKLQLADVTYRLEAVIPFSRHQTGTLRLIVAKDRRGYLGRRHTITATPDGAGGLSLALAEQAAEDPAEAGLSPAAVKVLDVLRAAGGPLTYQAIGDLVAARHGYGLRRPTISKVCQELGTRHLADEAEPGPRGAKYIMAVKPQKPSSD